MNTKRLYTHNHYKCIHLLSTINWFSCRRIIEWNVDKIDFVHMRPIRYNQYDVIFRELFVKVTFPSSTVCGFHLSDLHQQSRTNRFFFFVVVCSITIYILSQSLCKRSTNFQYPKVNQVSIQIFLFHCTFAIGYSVSVYSLFMCIFLFSFFPSLWCKI